MTCIVAIAGSPIYLAADSLGSTNYSKQEYKNSKLAKLKTSRDLKDHSSIPVDIGIGYTSSFRMGDLLSYVFKPPTIGIDEDVREYLVTAFIPKLIDCFDTNHYSRTKDGSKFGGVFIVGLEERIFIIQDDFSVLEPECGYASVGSGSDIALGALYASVETYDSLTAASLAVSAASNFTPSVGGEITTIEI